jgi:hypothetical protein
VFILFILPGTKFLIFFNFFFTLLEIFSGLCYVIFLGQSNR